LKYKLASVSRCHIFDCHHHSRAMISQLMLSSKSSEGVREDNITSARGCFAQQVSKSSHRKVSDLEHHTCMPRMTCDKDLSLGYSGVSPRHSAYRMSAMNLPDLDPAACHQTLHVFDLVSQLQEVAIDLEQVDTFGK